MSAGLYALVAATGAQAQSNETSLQQKKGPPQSVVESLIDSPRVVGVVPTSGAGETGYVSQKKKSQPKKKQAQKKLPARRRRWTPASSRAIRRSHACNLRPLPKSPARSRPCAGAVFRRTTSPFGPVGFTSGAFLLRPSIELQSGYDTNAQKAVNGKASWFNTLQGAFNAQSQWQRHELVLDLRGAYTAYNDVGGADRPEVQASLRGRIDVTSLTKIELESKFGLTTERAGSPDAIAAVQRQPNVYAFGQTAALVQRFNRFELTTGVGIERNVYENAELTSGLVTSLADRDYTAYSARLRGAYEWSPDVKPFAEASVDRRERDLPVDFNGITRDSDGHTLRAGLTFGRKEWLFGEVSAGISHRSYAAPALQDITGLIFDAQLTWLATGLTTFKLNAASGIDETSVLGASGVLRREMRLTMDHAFRRWLIGSASVGWLREEYEGTALVNDYLRISAALTYSLNRSLALKAEYRNEHFFSSVPGQDYTANIGLIGIRLQR
ncbi:MAG: outer membrane beta-barrel protein [Rhizobiales bacterium]|nr:outer membrane beta-barrel protein [Hyphomicrobiales bacterium]